MAVDGPRRLENAFEKHSRRPSGSLAYNSATGFRTAASKPSLKANTLRLTFSHGSRGSCPAFGGNVAQPVPPSTSSNAAARHRWRKPSWHGISVAPHRSIRLPYFFSEPLSAARL